MAILKDGSFRMDKGDYSPIDIDIGTRSLNMIQLKKLADGFAVQAIATLDMSEAEMRDSATMKKALKALKRKAPFVGTAAISRMPHAEVTIMPVKIEEKGEAIEQAVLREAGHYLPYPVEAAVIDYIPFHQESMDKNKVLLVAAQREHVDAHIAMLSAAGFDLQAIDIGPNALLKTFGFSQNAEKRRVLLINVGRRQTLFTALWDGDILIDRKVAWGEDHLVERLVAVLKVSPKEAREMFYVYGLNTQAESLPFPDPETERLPDEAVSAAISEITDKDFELLTVEMEKVLIYCSAETRGATMDHTYLLGAGHFVKNLHAVLEARLGIQIETLDPLRLFRDPLKKRYDPALFGVSVGLALRGFDRKAGGPNLMPADVLEARKAQRGLIRWAAAALAGTILLSATYGMTTMRSKPLKAEISSMMASQERAQSKKERIHSLQSKKTALLNAQRGYGLGAAQASMGEKLKVLSRIIPARARLTRLEMRPDGQILLNGRAYSNAEVARFLGSLQESSLFSGVALHYSRKEAPNKGNVFIFEIGLND